MQKDENSTFAKETQSRQEQCKEKCAWNLTTQQTKMNPPMSDPETNKQLLLLHNFENCKITLQSYMVYYS